jgi:hypothetical protein
MDDDLENGASNASARFLDRVSALALIRSPAAVAANACAWDRAPRP